MAKLLKAAAFAATLAACTSVSANATYYYYYVDVLADAGTYDPIALGDDITLDACGSTVHQAVATLPSPRSNDLCDFRDLSDFELTWQVSFESITTTLASYSGSSTVNGLTPTFSTGVGSLFASAGSYIISLIVDIPDGYTYIYLPDGYYGVGGCDAGINIDGEQYGAVGCTSTTSANINGLRNTGFDSTTLVINAVSVPEPSSALLLLPALALIIRRQRRRRKAA
ncbi:MAG: PEP-CTERM sorting domain-containing protein [Kordiimonadaceae bacterium]|nr:PEP-CTERM sorting domain-containing protein [Kordiimonadaceae bacterium]